MPSAGVCSIAHMSSCGIQEHGNCKKKCELALVSALGPLERAWYAKIHHVTSLWTSMGVSMETPPFTMTSFQSAYGQVVAWCEYSSSETDG